jgi:hypothetical protein
VEREGLFTLLPFHMVRVVTGILKNATMNPEDGVNLPSLRGAIQDRSGGTFEETVDKRPRRYTADTTPRRNEGRRTRERDYVRTLSWSYSNL